MKKILGLFLIMTSLSFSSNYTVTVSPNVKIEKSIIERNNTEIEREFEINTEANRAVGIESMNEEIEKQKNNLGIRIFGEILKAYILKIEFNIKKIEYISDKKATIIVTMKSPDLGNNLEFFEKSQEKIKKLFMERTGKTEEYLATVPEKEIIEKWLPILSEIITEIVTENINNWKKIEEEIILGVKKQNKKWNFVPKIMVEKE